MKIKQLLSLYLIYAKMDLAWLLRDTKYAVLCILADGISNVSAVGSVFLLALRFDGVGEMNRFEVLLMLGYVGMITGIYQTFYSANNTGHISRRIGRGQFEHMFLQPVKIPYQLMTEGFLPFTGSGNLLTSGLVVAFSLYKLNVLVTWQWTLALLANLFVSLTIIISQSYLFSTAAFYAPVAAEEISSTVIDLGGNLSQYPLSGMPRYIQIPLISLFPAGLLGWFPTMALLGKPPLNLPCFFPAIVAMILFLTTQYVFRKGLRHYVKTGANRYLPYGHRR